MIIWQAAVFAAYFIKGLAGFGNSLVHAGVMAFFLDNAVITPVDLILTAPANGLLLWNHRARLERRIWLPVALVSSAFLIPGALLLRNMDGRVVKLIFGVVVIALSLDMLRDRPQRQTAPSRGEKALLWALVTASGILSGMFGVGALVAAVMGRITKDSRAMKANISAVYVIDNVMRLIIYACTGLLTGERVLQALILVPAMGIGLFLGMRCAGRLSEHAVRLCIVCTLALSGLMLIVNNI